uniref:Uncharacterized protein n=1 Tax=Fundulus heteroclitus TaxID=8078 RepID=A0A3Q2QEU5_FUNHE
FMQGSSIREGVVSKLPQHILESICISCFQRAVFNLFLIILMLLCGVTASCQSWAPIYPHVHSLYPHTPVYWGFTIIFRAVLQDIPALSSISSLLHPQSSLFFLLFFPCTFIHSARFSPSLVPPGVVVFKLPQEVFIPGGSPLHSLLCIQCLARISTNQSILYIFNSYNYFN